MTVSLEKLVSMWDSPNDNEAMVAFQAARRAVLRDGSKFRDLVVPQSAAPLAVTHRPPVDVIAAGRFDTTFLLRKVGEGLGAHASLKLIRPRAECIHYTHRSTWDHPDSVWHCLKIPREPREQVRAAFRLVEADSAERLIFFTDHYERIWRQARRFAKRGIKVFSVLVGPAGVDDAEPLKRLGWDTGGHFGRIPHEKHVDTLAMPALLQFVGAA